MDNIFLKSFHIAGFTYYQGAYAFEELAIGTRLQIALDEGNIHDDNAVQLLCGGRKLGYVPRSENDEIAAILKAGHRIFEAVVQQVSPHEHPEQQVRAALFVTPKKTGKEGGKT